MTFCAGRQDVGCHGDWSRHEWLVFEDSDRDGIVDSAESVYLANGVNVSPDVTISSNRPLSNRVIFTSAGTAETATGAFAAGRLRLCVNGNNAANAIDLILIGSGRFESETKILTAGCAPP